jgi:hypothetical protein
MAATAVGAGAVATMTSRRSPAAAIVMAGSLALFLVVFALLVFQLRAGRDPALGAAAAQPAAVPAKRILLRKVVITKRIVTVEHDEERAAAAPASQRVVRSAPAPAPAPLVSRSS